MKACFLLPAMCILAISCWAQSSRSETVAVRGEISSPTPLVGYWTVELTTYDAEFVDKAALNGDNSFEFQALLPGPYMLRVISPNGEVVHEDGITIGNHVPITVHLPERRVETRSRDALVSLQQLRHKIPAAAVKAFLDGKKEASKGHLEAARTHYQRAATIDPEFAAVYNELGVVERGMNHLPEAAAQFQKALNLSPEDSLALPNLSVVLAQMQHYREALEVGRRALKVVSPQAATSVHYILALSLVAEKGDVGEMLLHFERAAPDYPKAHLAAADLLLKGGRPQDAIRHLEEYVQAAKPGDPQLERVEARLAKLRQ